MKNKSTFLLSLLLAACCLFGAGCATPTSEPPNKTEVKNITLSFPGGYIEDYKNECNITVLKGESFSLKAYVPVKNGYDFTCWTDGSKNYVSDSPITINNDLTLTAVWEKNQVRECTVQLDFDGGILNNTHTVEITANSIDLEQYQPIRRGYLLEEWKDEFGNSYLPNSIVDLNYDTKLTAVWTPQYSDTSNFEFELTDNGRAYSLKGFRTGKTLETVVVPAQYKGLPVTAISEGAFQDNHKIKYFVAENNITKIEPHIFDLCSNLREITLPMVIQNAANHTKTGDGFAVLFSNTEPTVDQFRHRYTKCGGFTSEFEDADTYYIPTKLQSVTVIGGVLKENSFRNMDTIQRLRLDSEVIAALPKNSISESDSLACLDLSGATNLETIGQLACRDNTALEEIDFSNLVKLKTIEKQAFSLNKTAEEKSSRLKNLDFSDCEQLETIGDNAFENCDTLESVNLNSCFYFKTFGNNAFKGCTLLKDIYLAPTFNIDTDFNVSSSFYDCENQINFVVPENSAFLKNIEGSLYSKDMKSLLVYAPNSPETTYVLPSSVEKIYPNAFNLCNALETLDLSGWQQTTLPSVFKNIKNLKKVILPDSLTDIPDKTFENCSALETVELPERLKTIGDSAFYNCTSLTTLNLPESIKSIGCYAFYNCSALSSALTLPASLAEIKEYAFYNCMNLKLRCAFDKEGYTADGKKIDLGTKWNYQIPADNIVYL